MKNLYWAQAKGTAYGKENAISPIFTSQKEYNEWKKEHPELKGTYGNYSERNFYNSNIGMSR